ncbi:MAG: EscU/YscU/HrcU family type III secretion system export apparatus switch protein [Gammaproteobacteria bacterium]|nr:EscU/YscU/HrcU family type III secretion system export apparatus switch protein [Gammaproteobacteria bacterium]
MKRRQIKNLAVALEYDGDNAPKIIAKGTDDLAEKIIAIAQQHNIPLHEDRNLIKVLAEIELGDEIPDTLYRAVAEVIAFAYILTGRFPEGFQRPDSDFSQSDD